MLLKALNFYTQGKVIFLIIILFILFSLVDCVDLTITPPTVPCCGKQKVKFFCNDHRFADRIYSITFTRNGKDVLKVTPPRNAEWVGNRLSLFVCYTSLDFFPFLLSSHINLKKSWHIIYTILMYT